MLFVQSKLAEAEEDAASQFERVSELENEVMLLEARATSAEAASKPVSYLCLITPELMLNCVHFHCIADSFLASNSVQLPPRYDSKQP